MNFEMSLLPENIKTRIFPNGKLRNQLKMVKQLVAENPSSEYAKSVLNGFRKKFWFGSKTVNYSHFYNEAWAKFNENISDGIFTIGDMKFVNDVALQYDFTGIFFSDKIQKQPVFELNVEQRIAVNILSLISTSEGSYTSDKVFLKENDIVIDAGANMGLFSLFATKQNPKKIYAFEPQKYAINILRKNIDLNHSDSKIKIIPLGLSNKDEDMKLSHSNESHSAASIIISRNENDDSEVIHCTTLDTWVVENNISRIDFIKADIEGAERNMLIGATKVLQEFVPRLAICTYHLKDDPEVLKNIILSANPNYVLTFTSHKLFGYVPE